MRTQIETSAAPPATGAYSQAIRAGNLVFVAGQLGADPTTGELADGVAAQAERVLLQPERGAGRRRRHRWIGS